MRTVYRTPTNAIALYVRYFNTKDVCSSELDKFSKLRDIPILTGVPRPVISEGSWKCKYRLNDEMKYVIRDVLSKRGWAEPEIKREIEQIELIDFDIKNCNTHRWRTVEDFQRTPWYERFNPTSLCTLNYVSYEALKILEEELIPPSLRGDPYAHLRRRHMESNYLYERSSEESARFITREKLAAQTKEMPSYNKVSRKQYLEFEQNYIKAKGSNMNDSEVYAAWQKSLEEEKKESSNKNIKHKYFTLMHEEARKD